MAASRIVLFLFLAFFERVSASRGCVPGIWSLLLAPCEQVRTLLQRLTRSVQVLRHVIYKQCRHFFSFLFFLVNVHVVIIVDRHPILQLNV